MNLRSLGHVARWLGSSCEDVKMDNPNRHEDADVAIYCVHGTADRCGSFSFIAEQLLPNLPDFITAIHMSSFIHRGQGASIEDFAQQLVEKILANGHHKVILMGHSRGGLVCAYLTEYLAKLGIEVQIVCGIGTPYGGSLKAGYFSWISESCEEMLPNSRFLKNLIPSIQNSSVPYYFFAADQDELVPLTSTYVEGQEDRLIILRHETHLSMMSSVELANHLLQRITPHEDNSLSLETLQTELQDYIQDFQNTEHTINEGKFKIKILNLLENLLINYPTKYKNVTTIGEFINAFMKDETLLSPKVSIFQAANTPLSSLIQLTNTTTANFLEGLSIRYKNVGLIDKRLENRMACL